MTFEEELKKETNEAIKIVANYLLTRNDVNLEKENKSLKGMWTYITSQARKKAVCNCACIDDETVFGWAVHYYDEDNIKVEIPKTVKKTEVVKSVVADKKHVAHKKEKRNEDQLSLFEDLL